MEDEALLRAKTIFNDALAVEPSVRMQYVRECCAGDESLRALVERLVAEDDAASRVFDHGPCEATALLDGDDEMETLLGTVVGHYRLIRLIATGGMGAVYEAEQDHPRRRVALKVLKSSLARARR